MNSLFHFHQRLDLKYEQARVSSPALNVSTYNKKVKWGLCEFNDCGHKCFLRPHTLWTERLAVAHAIYSPPPWICFHGCPVLVAASSPPTVLPSHAKLIVRSNFQTVINKKWGEASWMEVSGMTPSWAKSVFKLAFFIMTVSNSAIFTDAVSQSILGSHRLVTGLSGVFNPQNESENNTEHLEWTRCLLHKYYFSQQSKRQTSQVTV